jgi:hypothetical protein
MVFYLPIYEEMMLVTVMIIHLLACEDGTDRVFRNVGL